MTNRAFDLVVVGAGVIGLSIAYQLKKKDPALQVTLLGDPHAFAQRLPCGGGHAGPVLRVRKKGPFFPVLPRIAG